MNSNWPAHVWAAGGDEKVIPERDNRLKKSTEKRNNVANTGKHL